MTINILNLLSSVFSSPLIGINLSATLMKRKLLFLWTGIKKYSWLAFMIFFKKLVSYMSYRSLNYLESWLSDYLDEHFPEYRDEYPAKAKASAKLETEIVSVDESFLPLVSYSGEKASNDCDVTNKSLDIVSSFDSSLPSSSSVSSTNDLTDVVTAEICAERNTSLGETDSTENYYPSFPYMPVYRVDLFITDMRLHFDKYKMKPDLAHLMLCENSPKGSRQKQRLESFWKKNKNAKAEFVHLLATYNEIGQYALSDVITKETRDIAAWLDARMFTTDETGKLVFRNER